MTGVLMDANIDGYIHFLHRLLVEADLWDYLAAGGVRLATFADVGLDRATPDRLVWQFCQQSGWILLTENRNHDGSDSLEATLADSWVNGHLPVVTVARKQRFDQERGYALRAAADLAEIVADLQEGRATRNVHRIYIPR